MTAAEMHYDFKQKLNKIDSQKYRGLLVPEIDWKLNEAQEILVKIIANPRLKSQLGLESNQRTTDDIRTIVVDQKPSEGMTATPYGDDTSSFIALMPTDAWYYLNSKVYATKGQCKEKLVTRPVQHDDEQEVSPFDRSSFEWRVCNIRFNKEGVRMFTDGTFTVNKICFDYIKRPRIIHNAKDYIGGTYNTVDGVALTGSQNSELPVGVHGEIVDLAVLITAGDLSLPDYQYKYNKLNLTQQ